MSIHDAELQRLLMPVEDIHADDNGKVHVRDSERMRMCVLVTYLKAHFSRRSSTGNCDLWNTKPSSSSLPSTATWIRTARGVKLHETARMCTHTHTYSENMTERDSFVRQSGPYTQ